MLNKLINDIDIITEAISNEDYNDAIQMLSEVKEELKILSLINEV